MTSISVVIPLYNKEKFIYRAILSATAQSQKPLEIIVVNDGSTDNSAEIVENISDNLIRLIHQKNAGVSAARNRGIKEASGELIAFLDADDTWKPKFLETVLRLRKKYSEAGIYATAYERVYKSGEIISKKAKKLPPSPWEGIIRNYFKVTITNKIFFSSSVAIPKYIFDDLGGFVEGVPRGEDREMWIRIALKYPIAYSHYIGSSYYRDFDKRTYNSYVFETDAAINSIKNSIKMNIFTREEVLDLYNYIDMLKINDARRYIFIHHESVKAQKLLKEIQPKSYYIFFSKYWWLLWSRLPINVTFWGWNIKRKTKRILKKI